MPVGETVTLDSVLERDLVRDTLAEQVVLGDVASVTVGVICNVRVVLNKMLQDSDALSDVIENVRVPFIEVVAVCESETAFVADIVMFLDSVNVLRHVAPP